MGAIVTTAINAPHPLTQSAFNTGAGIGTDGAVFDNRLAQTFVATQSGLLFDVAFSAARSSFGETTAPLRLDITSWISDQPGVVLATTYVPIADFPTTMPHPPVLNMQAAFSGSTLSLVTGQTYALVFRTDTIEANYRIYGGYREQGGAVPGYPEGQAYKSQNSSIYQPMSSTADAYFHVRVNAVPEATTASLMATAALWFAGRRRRHKR